MYISHINAFNKEQTCREHCYNTASKAEAIISILRHTRHSLLVTDQGAAEKMLEILS